MVSKQAWTSTLTKYSLGLDTTQQRSDVERNVSDEQLRIGVTYDQSIFESLELNIYFVRAEHGCSEAFRLTILRIWAVNKPLVTIGGKSAVHLLIGQNLEGGLQYLIDGLPWSVSVLQQMVRQC